MFRSTQAREQEAGGGAVDVAPLLDVVFILLIFFLVTATFVEDTGLDVERPQATASRRLSPPSLRLSVGASGAVYTGGERVSLEEVSRRVRRFRRSEPKGSIIVIPDAEAAAERLVAVIDAAKRAGAKRIAIGTKRPGS